MRNPVKRHMHKAVRASVVASKRRSLLLDTTLRESTELLFESDLDKETKGFTGYSVDYTVLDELSEIIWEENSCNSCNSCLNDVGCSSVMLDSCIDDFEGEK